MTLPAEPQTRLADPVQIFAAGNLGVRVSPHAEALGYEAAELAASVLRSAIAVKGSARAILATGNSQFPLMAALSDSSRDWGIDWSKVTAFHMDEYVGIPANHSASFRLWMQQRVESVFHPAAMHYINGDVSDVAAECDRYEALLREAPIDLTCMGIGENGHLAFNEPHEADFNDARWAKVITLEAKSRAQQVGEGHFPDIAAVPAQAISLTIPALLSADHVVVSAPERRKAEAVRATIHDPISTACPGTILRECSHATLLLDPESASLL